MATKGKKNYWQSLWTVQRWFNAFKFSCAIGLGYYLGNMFFKGNWLVGIISTTVLLALIGGDVLDNLLSK